MSNPEKLINWAELSRLLSNDRSAITRKRIPKAHEKKIDDLLSLISEWKNKHV